MLCKECSEEIPGTNNVLARHLRKIHNLEWDAYIVKHDYAGVWPLCACNCGERLRWKKGGFERNRYNSKHGYRVAFKGEKNAMFGLKGYDNPNFGKTRTAEHRLHYSLAAQKRWDENYDERIKLFKDKNYIEKTKAGIKRSFETTDRAKLTSKSLEKFWSTNPNAEKLRKEAAERAIKLLEEGKIGPSAPFKVSLVLNPFTNTDERMHSSYETDFLNACIKIGLPVTKNHNITIDYVAADKKNRKYVPDFLSLNLKILFECKGYESENDKLKALAAKEFCFKNGLTYVFIHKHIFKTKTIETFLRTQVLEKICNEQ